MEVQPTRFSRLQGGTLPLREVPKPTKGQTAIEYALFAVFGILIVVAAVALWSTNSPSHKIVPNYVDEGLKNDRVNILLIGIGGDRHPGGGKELADSMLLMSVQPSTQRAAVISIPRDLWVRVGTYGMHRLNQAHAIGNQSGYPGEGPGLLSDTVAGIFDQKIHAFVRIDFSAFEKMINSLGGIDVYCQRSFYDYLFKDGFPRGWHHLDGKRALAYARYRYVIGPDGDNYARDQRQQQVVNAVREKLSRKSPQDALRLIQVMSTLSNHTETNLTTAQLVTLYRRFHTIKQTNVRHVSLKPLTEVFEVSRLTDPGEAIRPRAGDYRELRATARDIFKSGSEIRSEDQIQLTGAIQPQAPPSSAASLR